MKQSRPRATALAALLVAVSLVCATQDGGAKPLPRLVPADPRPTQEMGEPETPPDTGPRVSFRVWLSSVLLAKGVQADLAIALGVSRRPGDTLLAPRVARVAVNP